MGRDAGLTIRMLAALTAWALVVLGVIAFLVWVALEVHYMVAGFGVLFIAMSTQVGETKAKRGKHTRERRPEDEIRLERVVTRLAMMAEIAPPAVRAQSQRAPAAWTRMRLRGRPIIHVTTGLLDLLDDPQLEAVVAHEIAHLANGDAKVLTIVTGLPATFRRHAAGENPVGVLVYLGWLIPAMALMSLSGRIVSRHRELAADRGAALITGSPAAVAGALLTVSADIEVLRARDESLGDRVAGDVFLFLPLKERGRVWATHPPLAKRIACLERMEAHLQR